MTIEGVDGEVPADSTLTEFDPPRKLAYESSLPSDESMKTHVVVEFFEIEEGTKVRLVHSGIPDMRVDGGFELREIVKAGWSAAFEKLDRLFVETS